MAIQSFLKLFIQKMKSIALIEAELSELQLFESTIVFPYMELPPGEFET